MSAPERIWAFAPDVFDNMSVWQDEPSLAGDATEYVRRDTTYTDADMDRAVRAALEAAASEADRIVSDTVYFNERARDMDKRYATAIRALDPAAIVASVKRGEGE